MLAGIDKAELIFNLVFFISVSSVLLQGTTLAYIGRLLHVILPASSKRKDGTNALEHIRSHMQDFLIGDSSQIAGKKIVELKIPLSIHIMSIKRGELFIQPVGSTKLKAGDVVYILADDEIALNIAKSYLSE